jgi:prophage antirepressor-like protein
MNATVMNGAAAELAFDGLAFDVTVFGGVSWLRLPQIGVALGYASPYKAQQVYDRNADEFTPDMTQVMPLPTAGGVQQVRVFSLRGAHLLGMLANTDKAKAFRRWVLDVLDQESAKLTSAAQPIYPATHPPLTEDLSAAREAMLDAAALMGMVQRSLSAVPVAGDAVRSLNAGRFLLEQFANTLDGVLAASPATGTADRLRCTMPIRAATSSMASRAAARSSVSGGWAAG